MGPDRFPLLLWGDLVRGGQPVLRRVLAGSLAHECMYAWVYLTDYLAVERLKQSVRSSPRKKRAALFEHSDEAMWTKFDRSSIDPHFQLGRSAFEMVALAALVASSSGSKSSSFVELGSTFFTAKSKLDIVNSVATAVLAGWKPIKPRWIGVDNSSFMHDVTRILHGAGSQVLVQDLSAIGKRAGFNALLSRFVASYVFRSSEEFVRRSSDGYDALILEDAFSTVNEDVHIHNHGQPETFLALPGVFSGLESAGFVSYMVDSYPDFPAGAAPCHVVKFVAVRGKIPMETVFANAAKLGFSEISRSRRIDAGTILEELKGSVTGQQWDMVRTFKERSPVWGKTPEKGTFIPKSVPRSWLGSDRGAAGPWSNDSFRSEAIQQEILRALAQERGD